VSFTCADDRAAVIDLLNRYATCLDNRDWPGLDHVFHPDATGFYGSLLHGRAAIVTSIRSFLSGCGPSQHLLGNHHVEVDGQSATSLTQARVIHVGSGDRAQLTPYEAIGTYRDKHVKTPDGWRIMQRHFDVRIALGDIGVLNPG